MGSSSAWQNDDQLHDAVERQLGCEPEIHADNIAKIGSTELREECPTYSFPFNALRLL